MKNSILSLFIAVLFLSSCKKDNGPNDGIKYIPSGMFVVNEGQFMGGNASISYFRTNSSYTNVDLYSAINNVPLGDVAQSMSIFNGFGYIVVNNSKKVEVVNMNDFHRAGTINGLESPRHFLGINNNTGYVSDWTANNIKIINLVTNTVTGTIPCGAGPEEMLLTNNKVFVCNVGGFGNDSTITVIDVNTNSVISTIQVGLNPNSIKQDNNGNIWVLCGGTIGADYTPGTADDIGGTLIQIDPTTYSIIKQLNFASDQHPLKMNTNSAKDKLYYLQGNSSTTGKVFRMYLSNPVLPTTALVNREFYGLGIDPLKENIYGGIGNFTVNTYILKYQSNGTFVDSLKVGVAPNGFAFN